MVSSVNAGCNGVLGDLAPAAATPAREPSSEQVDALLARIALPRIRDSVLAVIHGVPAEEQETFRKIIRPFLQEIPALPNGFLDVIIGQNLLEKIAAIPTTYREVASQVLHSLMNSTGIEGKYPAILGTFFTMLHGFSELE